MTTDCFCSVVNQFEKSCQEYAQRDVLYCLEKTLSYQQLYTDVNQYALHMKHTVSSGSKVLIYLEKGMDYIKSIYGALSIGAIYVPIDASQPIERITTIIEQAQADLIVTSSKLAERLPSLMTPLLVVEGIQLNEEADIQSTGEGIRPFYQAKSDEIAAILFTSGSTGTPKGVQISHGNLVFFINWSINELELTEKDVLSNHAPFSFDLSTFDIFAAGAVGASTWVITAEQQMNVAELIKGVKRHQLSVWYSVPSVLSMMVATGALTEHVTSLRHVIFAGEVFPLKALNSLAECLPTSCSLYNWYGPTETNVCFFHKMTPEDLQLCVPIGQPLPGLDILLRNEQGQVITEENEVGELLVYGQCVTPGYANINNEAIMSNHQVHCHATGDLVHVKNGIFYFHGRNDDMVKVRGNRIELGEIENCIAHMQGVEEVAVVCVTDDAQTKLVAFMVTNEQINLLSMKQYVSQHLPKYMIPNALRKVEILPYTSNGKVDRKKLKKVELEGVRG